MEKETSYIETLIKKIAADKSRMAALIFGALSVICSLMYLTSVSASGIHLIFVLAMIAAAATVVIYTINVDAKIKFADDFFVFGIGAIVLALILKVARVGISFSLEYIIGYTIYSIAFLLVGIYCTKKGATTKLLKIILILCAIWSLYQFFFLNSAFIKGIIWKFFRISEAFLAFAYFSFINLEEKQEVHISEKIGGYKNQIPSQKICIALVLIVTVLFGTIGFVMDLSNSTTTVTNIAIEDKKPVEKPKKSTVTSTVVPAEEEPKEIEEIQIGDSIETDSFTLKLNKVEISRRVQPDNPPSYYTYYQAETDHTYIYVNASITNKDKYPLECDEIYSVTADFDGGYTYSGFNIADDYDGDFTYANITSVEPLATLGVHSLVDCPQLVEEEGKSLFITINLKNGSKYKYIIK